MTLTTLPNRIAYTGGGGVTVFPYPFLITSAADLLVYANDVLQTTGYSVSNVGLGSGGNVTFTVAPASGVALVFLRSTDRTQQVNLIEGDKLPAEPVEGMFDKVYALCQDLWERTVRAVKVPPTSANATVEVYLPDPALPANQDKALFINGSGQLEARAILSGSTVGSPIVAKGDLVQGSNAGTPERLAIGATGQILTVVGGKAAWGAGDIISKTILDAKGDLITATGDDTPVRKAVGANGTVLTADSSQADGLRWGTPGGVEIPLRIEAATPPDGTGSTNGFPELVREISTAQTANTPKRSRTFAKFDSAIDENLCWGFQMPANYGSGGTIRLKWKAATATSGNVVWKAGFGATIDGTTDDDALVYAAEDAATMAAPGTQGQVAEITINLTMTNALAGRDVSLFIGRKATSGADTMTGDAILMSARLEYTPA